MKQKTHSIDSGALKEPFNTPLSCYRSTAVQKGKDYRFDLELQHHGLIFAAETLLCPFPTVWFTAHQKKKKTGLNSCLPAVKQSISNTVGILCGETKTLRGKKKWLCTCY